MIERGPDSARLDRPERSEWSDPVFRLEGEYWTVHYDGAPCRLKDTKGMQYLAALLTRPSERIAVTDLPQLSIASERADAIHRRGSPGPAAHSAAHSATDIERARVRVTRAIKAALRRIAAHHATLAAHLEATVRTGAYCAYVPDPRLPITWER